MHKEVEQAYWNGFSVKCAEVGVDPVKVAQEPGAEGDWLDRWQDLQATDEDYTVRHPGLAQLPFGQLLAKRKERAIADERGESQYDAVKNNITNMRDPAYAAKYLNLVRRRNRRIGALVTGILGAIQGGITGGAGGRGGAVAGAVVGTGAGAAIGAGLGHLSGSLAGRHLRDQLRAIGNDPGRLDAVSRSQSERPYAMDLVPGGRMYMAATRTGRDAKAKS